MKENPERAVHRWTKKKFLFSSGYYAGRGPRREDLDSKILEEIYQGLANDVAKEAASNFVRLVNNLTDLSASSFIIAFERFYYKDCKEVNIQQNKGDRTRLTARGDALLSQAFASALCGKPQSEESIRDKSNYIKERFICVHLDEIPADERKKFDGFRQL